MEQLLFCESIFNDFFDCDRKIDWFTVDNCSNFGNKIDLSLDALKVGFFCDITVETKPKKIQFCAGFLYSILICLG